MKSNKIPQLKTQIAIVKKLLDGKKTTQQEIANLLKKDASTISKALDHLNKSKVVESCLKPIPSGNKIKGNYDNVVCWLSYDKNTEKNILIFFRNVLNSKRLKVYEKDELVWDLVKENKFVDLLISDHFWLIDYCKFKTNMTQTWSTEEMCNSCLLHLNESPICGFNEIERQKCLQYLKNPKQISDAEAENFLDEYEKSIQKELRMEFKNRLKMSPYFFQICLTKTDEELRKEFNNLFRLTLDSLIHKNPYGIIYMGNEPDGLIISYLNKIFEICIFYDILNNKVSEEALRYVEKINVQKAHVLEDIEKLDVQSFYENPDLLKWKYETAIKKPLHHKIKIDTKKIKYNLKLTNESELNVFLKMNQFTEDEIKLSHLLVGGLFKGNEIMKIEEIIIGLRRQVVTQQDTFIKNLLEKLRNTKRQDGSTNTVMDTVDFGNRWYCPLTFTKSNTQ